MYELKYFSTLQTYSVQPADLKKVGNIFQLRLSPSYISHLIITQPFFFKKKDCKTHFILVQKYTQINPSLCNITISKCSIYWNIGSVGIQKTWFYVDKTFSCFCKHLLHR